MSSTRSSIAYHEKMEQNNAMIIDDDSNDSSLALSYEDKQERAIRVSKVADLQNNTRPQCNSLNASNPTPQCVLNKDHQSNTGNKATQATTSHEDEVINIQLPYDPQAPTEPELWSGSFHPISLHGSIEHFASDAKNIKVSLNFLAKYIQGKQVNGNKVNDLNDFDGMGDAIWNFISSVYASKWDALFTDQKSNTLREKISSKFTPRIPPTNSHPTKDISKSTPVTINKAPPPLLAKSKKEINVISKYFQHKKPTTTNSKRPINQQNKSYAQASKSMINMSEVLKIKETFPALNAKKINQVNDIVNGQSKPKPHIKMTTKGPSRKNIIILMSSDNASSFMRNSSLNVANINRDLQNARTDILVDYIKSDNTGIIVTTNKIAQQSDLSIIDHCVKNSNDINSLQVEDPRLPKSKSYLKIIGILYYPHADSREKLSSADIETVLKQNHIFDNISLASRLRIIKVSPKSDIAIVWINIWDVQSGRNTKLLINRCFNVGNYIATVRGAIMNPVLWS